MNEKWIAYIASLGQRALLYEAMLYPKPGLVDPISRGAHKDMDITTFIDSALALGDGFYDFVRIGAEHAFEDPKKVQTLLRKRGILSEQEMYLATSNVNTHKGIIYSMAFCLCAVGRILSRAISSGEMISMEPFLRGELFEVMKGHPSDRKAFLQTDPMSEDVLIERIIAEVKELSAGILVNDMKDASQRTHRTVGEMLYLDHGLRGARGEVEDGFPMAQIGYRYLKERGSMERTDLLRTLLLIMETNCDTNVIARGGFDSLEEVKNRSKELLQLDDRDLVSGLIKMDEWCIEHNISPGGSADLLSVAIFLYLINFGGKRWKN